jgi:hypothetical protein
VLRLSARGIIDESVDGQFEYGLSLGHESIVQAFRDIAGASALQFWGLRT